MFGGDGMDSSTQLPVVSCVWVPAALSYHARLSMLLPFMDLALIPSPGTESPRAWLLRARVRFKLGREEDLLWADR
jgi:hypothetical protein